LAEAATAVVFLQVDEAELANRNRYVPRYLLPDDLLLFYHAHGLTLYLMELELDLLLDDHLFDHPDLLNFLLNRLH